MAWIKLRTDLVDDPAVIAMSAKLRIDRFGIVGRLHNVWSWATDQLVDGNAPGVTGAFLDQRISTPGFAASMAKVGWLLVSRDGITFPKWDSHLSNGAKNRALTAKRVGDHRKSGNAASVTKTLPEERQIREEKNLSCQTAPPANETHLGDSSNGSVLAVWLETHSVGEPAASRLAAAGLRIVDAERLWVESRTANNPVAAFVAAAQKHVGIHKSNRHIGGTVNGVLADANAKLRQARENHRRAQA